VLSPAERLSQQELRRRHAAVRAKMKQKGLRSCSYQVSLVASTGYLGGISRTGPSLPGGGLYRPGRRANCSRENRERAPVMKEFLGLRLRPIHRHAGCPGLEEDRCETVACAASRP
jgi:hypothetical protein